VIFFTDTSSSAFPYHVAEVTKISRLPNAEEIEAIARRQFAAVGENYTSLTTKIE